MLSAMKDQHELVTKKMFLDGMSRLETSLEKRFDTKIDALALSTQQEFVAVRGEMKEMEGRLEARIIKIEENMATKQDLFRMEARILSAIGDIAIELKNHDRRILALEKIVKP